MFLLFMRFTEAPLLYFYRDADSRKSGEKHTIQLHTAEKFAENSLCPPAVLI